MNEVNKAFDDLSHFLKLNPELQEFQNQLEIQMALLSNEDRLTFLSVKIKENLQELKTELEKLESKTKELTK